MDGKLTLLHVYKHGPVYLTLVYIHWIALKVILFLEPPFLPPCPALSATTSLLSLLLPTCDLPTLPYLCISSIELVSLLLNFSSLLFAFVEPSWLMLVLL
jgi:hypothetical protein